jgi:hypothetical protein
LPDVAFWLVARRCLLLHFGCLALLFGCLALLFGYGSSLLVLSSARNMIIITSKILKDRLARLKILSCAKLEESRRIKTIHFHFHLNLLRPSREKK